MRNWSLVERHIPLRLAEIEQLRADIDSHAALAVAFVLLGLSLQRHAVVSECKVGQEGYWSCEDCSCPSCRNGE